MKHHISIFFLFLTLYCWQISQPKFFLAKIDTGKEELDKVQGTNPVRHNPQNPQHGRTQPGKKQRKKKKERRRRKKAEKDYPLPLNVNSLAQLTLNLISLTY